MRVSEVFAMGGDYGHGHNYGSGYSGGYYPDYGRWSYHYYQGPDYSGGYGHGYGYGYTHSHGLLGVLA